MDGFKELRLPRLKNCCCCSLEIGAKLVALFHVVVVGSFFLFIFIMLTIDQFKRHQSGYSYYYDFHHAFMRDEYIAVMVYSYIFFSSVLYYGISRGETIYMEPWLIMKAIDYSTNIINASMFIYEILTWHKNIEIFVVLGLMCLDAYFIVIVHSHYKELKGKRSDDN